MLGLLNDPFSLSMAMTQGGGQAPVQQHSTMQAPQQGPQGNNWQTALDIAEQGRNYNNSFSNYASNQNYINDGNGGATVDWAHAPTPSWNGPDAYGLSKYGNGQTFGEGDEAEANATLSRIRQFDPNAALVRGTRESGGEGGGNTSSYYTLNFDPSKLPNPVHEGGATVGPYGNNKLYNNNNDAMYWDPHYGVMTNPRNIDRRDGFDWLGVLGPLAVGGFAGALGGGGVLSQLFRQGAGAVRGLANGQNPFNISTMMNLGKLLPPGGL